MNWLDAIFTRDELDVDPSTFREYRAASLDALLTTFDEKVTSGKGIQKIDLRHSLHAAWRTVADSPSRMVGYDGRQPSSTRALLLDSVSRIVSMRAM